jgi:hypothetical protein
MSSSPRGLGYASGMGSREIGVVLAFAAATGGCGEDPKASSTLTITDRDAGTDYHALWTYRSFDVDVDLTLTTRLHEADCSTTSTLRVNDALSGAESYDLAPTPCTTLRLGPDGDIVMDDSATGVDWTSVDLAVNTDTEVISLGPARGADPETGDTVDYTFSIAAPPCGDGSDCECGVLRRAGGPTPHALALGRVCD